MKKEKLSKYLLENNLENLGNYAGMNLNIDNRVSGSELQETELFFVSRNHNQSLAELMEGFFKGRHMVDLVAHTKASNGGLRYRDSIDNLERFELVKVDSEDTSSISQALKLLGLRVETDGRDDDEDFNSSAA